MLRSERKTHAASRKLAKFPLQWIVNSVIAIGYVVRAFSGQAEVRGIFVF
ncbi:MAG: hypothetical protein JWM11_1069 [Planctomycetaceae bacterium]|nr:hypothetical protein [Planctomycetaceae bacterium]